jgi:anti-sigma B factor antagonist
VAVVDLSGRLAAGIDEFEFARLRRVTGEVIEAGCLEVVVSLCGLTLVDARGLGALATMMHAVRAAGGRVTLVAAPARLARMLTVTGLDRVFGWPAARAGGYERCRIA